MPKFIFKKHYFDGKINLLDGSISYEMFKKRSLRSYAAFDALGEHPNLVQIYPEKILYKFIDNRCAAHINSEPLYLDSNHLSDFGAKYVMKEILGILDND